MTRDVRVFQLVIARLHPHASELGRKMQQIVACFTNFFGRRVALPT